MQFDKQAADISAQATAYARERVNASTRTLWSARAVLAELESAYIRAYTDATRDAVTLTDRLLGPVRKVAP